MYDLEIHLADRCGELASMGKELGKAGISVEGGGVWVVGGRGVAHFLFHDGPAAQRALEAAGVQVISCSRVLRLRLKQEIPGQLGLITDQLAKANVNVSVLYSDHANHLILVVDDIEKGATVVEDWTSAQTSQASQEDS